MLRIWKAIALVCAVVVAGNNSAQAGQDVVLGPGGILRGRVVGPGGGPAPGALVTLRNGRWSTTTTTNGEGVFSVQSVGPGVLEIETSSGSQSVRAWSADTAPPAAENAAFLRPERPGNRGGVGFDRRAERSGLDFSNHPSLTAPLIPVSP